MLFFYTKTAPKCPFKFPINTFKLVRLMTVSLSTCSFLFSQDLVRKGVPHHFRAIVWQLLCNAQNMPIKDQYSELLKMTSPCEKLIRRDIARTYPEHEFFKEKDSLGQEVLFNVMKVNSRLCLRNMIV